MLALNPDATTSLLRGLRARLASEADLVVERLTSRAWASATFTGARHLVDVRLEGAGAEAAADRFLDNLDEADFALRGHILADIKLVSQRRYRGETGMAVALSFEALTVEDE